MQVIEWPELTNDDVQVVITPELVHDMVKTISALQAQVKSLEKKVHGIANVNLVC